MMFDALKKYAVFSGRARRKEYWMFILLYIISYVIAIAIDMSTGMLHEPSGYGVFTGLLTLGLILPFTAVLVRRLHDIDKSGWWALLSFVPLVNLVLVVFACMDGTEGENRFGPDTKVRENVGASNPAG